jgi:hypothetical protein
MHHCQKPSNLGLFHNSPFFLNTGEHYKYEWTFLAQPEGVNSGIMNDQNGETLKLSHLIEGLYMFKVSVSAPGAYGETYANVTVLPREYH